MTRVSKLVTVLLVIGAGFAAWQYGLFGQIQAKLNPQVQQAGTSGAGQPGGQAGQSGQGSKRGGSFPIAVKVAQASRVDFPLIERGYGAMASPQVVAINARVASQIIKVNVADGQMVKKGDVLVELDDRTLQATLAQAQAQLVKDQAVLANDNIVLQRAQQLAARNAGPLQDVDNAMAAQRAQVQVIDADKAAIDADKLQLDFAKVQAPFDGKLGTVNAVPGQLVAASTNSVASTSLMTITQMQPLKVNFRLPQQVLPPLQEAQGKGTKAVVRVYTSGTHNLQDQGELNFIDSAVDATTGTIGLAASVPNGKLALWPGESVDVELEYGKITSALSVPLVAVQQGQQGAFVWQVDEQNKVKAVPVKVSRYDNNMASISDGLSDGASVVVEGQAKLANGAEVRTGGQGGASTSDAKPADAIAAKPADGAAQAAPPSAAADDATQTKHKKKDAAATAGSTQP